MRVNIGSAIVNGTLTTLDAAMIPALDRGFLFGHSVFETILILNGKIILWEEHLLRLQQGCAKSFIVMPDPFEILNQIKRAVHHNILLTGKTAKKMQIRLIVSGGTSLDMPISKGDTKLSEATLSMQPTVVILCRDARIPADEKYKSGLKLKTLQDTRSTELMDIKSCNYLWNIIALEYANNQSFDDALFYNSKNEITESTTSNFIWLDQNNEVSSAPFKNNCLPGTTYLCLQRALHKVGHKVAEKALLLDSISSARGCAILSSVRGLVPICQIDSHLFNISLEEAKFLELNQLLEAEQEKSAVPIQSL